MVEKKVFISGCFDCFHSGHAEFLRTAAELGDVYVSVGSDKNVYFLKEVKPTFTEKERRFIVSQIKGVKEAFVSKEMGKIDFLEDLERIKPDIFVVNEEGHTKEKKRVCAEKGVEYIVLKRTPQEGLPIRSSTELRSKTSRIPFRLDLCGGWLDQPYVSEVYPGPVITISIEPDSQFNFRSGMASSTRNKAISLWQDNLPEEDPVHLAKVLFSFENPPGTREKAIAGAQDAIGIAIPGIAYSFFDKEYWPKEIKQCSQEDVISWLEDRIYLAELKPRGAEYSPFTGAQITTENVKALSFAAEDCYKAILRKDFSQFANSVRKGFETQSALFPATFPDWINPVLQEYREQGAVGWKLSGAGGGGYLVLISEKPLKNTRKIHIRRK